MFEAIRTTLRPGIAVRDVAANLNDPPFAEAAVETFMELWARRDA